MDDSIKALLSQGFEDAETRRQYAAALLNARIALQIKTLRQQRGWSQTKLAKLAGKHQSQISEMESIDFSSWKISTLMQLAEAFDLALTVNFESFGNFLDEATSLGRDKLERPSFADDPAFRSDREEEVTKPDADWDLSNVSDIRKFVERRGGSNQSLISAVNVNRKEWTMEPLQEAAHG